MPLLVKKNTKIRLFFYGRFLHKTSKNIEIYTFSSHLFNCFLLVCRCGISRVMYTLKFATKTLDFA